MEPESVENKKTNSNSEIEVKFLTDLPEKFKIPNSFFTIPTSYDSMNLNDLVKKLLKIKKDFKRKFSFFIHDIKLDTNVSTFINSHIKDASASEKVLEIFYAFETEEPNQVNTIKEDEWIRKISVLKGQDIESKLQRSFCVGLFNSELSIYNKDCERIIQLGNKNKDEYCELLHDVLYFQPNGSSLKNILISCSRNEEKNLNVYSIDESRGSHCLLYSNTKQGIEYIHCLSLNPQDLSYFSAGGTNGSCGTLQIFHLPTEEEEDEVKKKISKKKRKIDAQEITPEAIFEKCHATETSLVKWMNNHQILSSGDDYFINLWNIHTKSSFMSFNTNYKYITSLLPVSNTRFLSGHQDGSIKLWDTISGNKAVVTFPSKDGSYVAEICQCPDLEYYSNIFATAGYDSNVKVWDMRLSGKALYEIKTDSEKNYAVAYNGSQQLMSGGDSSKINIYSC